MLKLAKGLPFAVSLIQRKLAEMCTPETSELPVTPKQIRDRTAKVQPPRVITLR